MDWGPEFRGLFAETWLLDLGTDRVEVYRRPAADGYAKTRVLTNGDGVAPEAQPDLCMTVRELLR